VTSAIDRAPDRRAPPSGNQPATAPRRLSTAALVIYACSLALLVGVGSVFYAVTADYPFGSVTAGPWKAWPKVGSTEADPYAQAMVARRGEIPLAVGEGLALTASVDSLGEPLDARCLYRVAGTTPSARLWTLTVYDSDRQLIQTDLGRNGITSAEVLRRQEGDFIISLSKDLEAGNWVQLPDGRFTLTLRLYDTTAAAGSGSLDEGTLPTIDRGECR
jgi:hypothetical protein